MQQAAELTTLHAALQERDEAILRLNGELAEVRRAAEDAAAHAAQGEQDLESVRAETAELRAAVETTRQERDEALARASGLDAETRRLTDELEEARRQAAQNAQEVERLTSALNDLKTRGAVSETREAFALHHSLSDGTDELWKRGDRVDSYMEGVPSNSGQEPGANGMQDEQKMLVDALLRFLGRR